MNGILLRYRQSNFNEAAMRRKIIKNMAARWTYQTLYDALGEELKMAEAHLVLHPEDVLIAKRRVELLDQQLFMREHQREFGAALRQVAA